MDLMPFTRRGSDGRLDTEICLLDPQLGGPMEVSVERLLGSFGSIHNGGLSRLIQFTNAVHQMVLQQTIAGATDGLANCRIFGPVYLVALQLAEFGIDTGWTNSGPEKFCSSGAFLPTLIAALLDPLSRASETPRSLSHRYFCAEPIVFSADTVHDTILAIAKFHPDGADYSKELNSTELNIAQKLAAWSSNDDPFLSSSLPEKLGAGVMVHIAKAIVHQAEQLTGMGWSSLYEDLRDLQAVLIEQRGRKLYLTTRLSSAQMSVYYRLDMPLPPLMISADVDDRHGAFDYAAADRFDDSLNDVWTSNAA